MKRIKILVILTLATALPMLSPVGMAQSGGTLTGYKCVQDYTNANTTTCDYNCNGSCTQNDEGGKACGNCTARVFSSCALLWTPTAVVQTQYSGTCAGIAYLCWCYNPVPTGTPKVVFCDCTL
jgi:hypothetical protein